MTQTFHLNWYIIIPNSNTSGNNYKLLNQSFDYDARKYCFSARIVNIWNSLPNDVVNVNNVNQFKTRLDKFWMHQDVKFDFTAHCGYSDCSPNRDKLLNGLRSEQVHTAMRTPKYKLDRMTSSEHVGLL